MHNTSLINNIIFNFAQPFDNYQNETLPLFALVMDTVLYSRLLYFYVPSHDSYTSHIQAKAAIYVGMLPFFTLFCYLQLICKYSTKLTWSTVWNERHLLTVPLPPLMVNYWVYKYLYIWFSSKCQIFVKILFSWKMLTVADCHLHVNGLIGQKAQQ